MLIFALVNALWYIFLARVTSATDQEWHKYIVFMTLDILTQFTIFIATLAVSARQYSQA